jgi:hypothetical protein
MPDTSIVRVPLDSPGDGDETPAVLVELDAAQSGVVRAARPGAVAATAVHSLSETFDQVRAAAEVALARLTSLSVQPRTVELELGVKINAEAGAVIARTAAEGNITLRLTWERPAAAPRTDAPRTDAPRTDEPPADAPRAVPGAPAGGAPTP